MRSQLSAIDAAYPDYAEFFGTDGAYSSHGLAVSGQWQTAVNWLNTIVENTALGGGQLDVASGTTQALAALLDMEA